MIDTSLIIKDLIKTAKAKALDAACSKCNSAPCKCKKEEVKTDSTKEARIKVAALMEELASNLEQILPQSATSKLAADVAYATHPAPRAEFKLKQDDMGHTKHDPTKPSTKKPTLEFKTDEKERTAGGQEPLINKSAKQVLGKLAANGVETRTTETGQAGAPTAGKSSGSEFGGREMSKIHTIQGVIDVTKRDLKTNYIKDQVGKMFKHVDPEKDTVVKQVITHGANTSKLAGLEVLKKMKNLVSKEEKEDKTVEKTAFFKEYLNHSALNLGQAARDIRWIHNHPDADKMGPEGSAKHIAASITSRLPSLASNLYYTALPPQLHHSDEELKEIKDENPKDNFLLGYAPWEYRKKEEAVKKLASILKDPTHPKYNTVVSRIKQAAGMPPQDPTAGMGVVPEGGQPGQGQPPMKEPGCTCQQGMDGQPLCPVCKIKEIVKMQQMQQMQGQAQGQAPAPGPQAPTGGVQNV